VCVWGGAGCCSPGSAETGFEGLGLGGGEAEKGAGGLEICVSKTWQGWRFFGGLHQAQMA